MTQVLICYLLYMQDSKSYEDLKAELGNSGDWSQITAVSTGGWVSQWPLLMVRPMGTEKA